MEETKKAADCAGDCGCEPAPQFGHSHVAGLVPFDAAKHSDCKYVYMSDGRRASHGKRSISDPRLRYAILASSPLCSIPIYFDVHGRTPCGGQVYAKGPIKVEMYVSDDGKHVAKDAVEILTRFGHDGRLWHLREVEIPAPE